VPSPWLAKNDEEPKGEEARKDAKKKEERRTPARTKDGEKKR
jgi:hypothetical protein